MNYLILFAVHTIVCTLIVLTSLCFIRVVIRISITRTFLNLSILFVVHIEACSMIVLTSLCAERVVIRI